MKLSDLNPDDYQIVQPTLVQQPTLRLSDLVPGEYQVEKPDAPAATKVQAALEGFGQAATAGYLPQIQAAVGGLIPDPNKDIDAKLQAQGFQINQPEDTYVSRRDANISRQQELAKQAPVQYYGGEVGGALATAPALSAGLGKLGLGAAKGAGLIKNVGKAAAGGAILGAAQNPGDAPGQVDPVQAEERLKNAGSGAALGGAIQGGAEAASKTIKIVRGMPDFLSDFAEQRGAAATGIYKGQAKAAIKMDPTGQEGKNLKELGRYVLDNKVVRVGDNIEDVAQRSGQMKKAVGEQIGNVYDTASQMLQDPKEFARLSPAEKSTIMQTNFAPKRMAQDFLDQLGTEMRGTPEGDETLSRAQRLMSNFTQKGEKIGIRDVQGFKEQLDDMIYKADTAFARTGAQTPGIEAVSSFRDFLKTRIDARMTALDSVFGKSLGTDLKDLNKNYSMLAKVNSIARNRLSGEMGNNFLSLTDKMAMFGGAGAGGAAGYRKGGIGGAVEGAAVGAGLGLASKAARTYGRPMMTIAADKAGKALSTVPGGAAAGLLADTLRGSPGLVGAGTANLVNQPQSLPAKRMDASPRLGLMLQRAKMGADKR